MNTKSCENFGKQFERKKTEISKKNVSKSQTRLLCLKLFFEIFLLENHFFDFEKRPLFQKEKRKKKKERKEENLVLMFENFFQFPKHCFVFWKKERKNVKKTFQKKIEIFQHMFQLETKIQKEGKNKSLLLSSPFLSQKYVCFFFDWKKDLKVLKYLFFFSEKLLKIEIEKKL